MMEKELIQLYESAQKAADIVVDGGAAEEERCIDALNQLKKFPVNYQVLVSSQVGKRLRGLTKHKSNKIKVLASEVVEIWKEIIVKETSKNKANAESSVKSDNSKSIKVEVTVKVEAKKNQTGSSNSDKKTEPKKIEKPIIKDEKSSSNTPLKLNSLVSCKDPARDKIRELISEALSKVVKEVDEDLKNEVSQADPFRVAVLLETAMYEKWGKSNGSQKVKYRSVMFNLKDPKNPDFRRRVLLGEYEARVITELSVEDMASDERKKQIDDIKEKALFECERGQPQKASTNEFKCSRCGKRETTYYQLQTRSADEPMTTYVTCVNCGKRWKFC